MGRFAVKSLFDKPFALSIGPQRAATTWLDRYLRARGDVCLPLAVKETLFFNRYFHKGPAAYRAHFFLQPAHQLAMEVTAQSFDCPGAPARVRHLLGGDVRLLCPLRHPITRSYSLYLHYLRYGLVRGPLRAAAEHCPQLLTSSHYADHLARWYDVFGAEAIALTYQEELEKDPVSYLQQTCAALGLPYYPPGTPLRRRCNVATTSPHPWLARLSQKGADWLRACAIYTPINLAKRAGLKEWIFGVERPLPARAMPPEDHAWLQDRLSGEIEKFEKLTGRTAPYWHTLPGDDLHRAA